MRSAFSPPNHHSLPDTQIDVDARATGEDYVVPFVNAISVETDDPRELVAYLTFLKENPKVADKIFKEIAAKAKIAANV